MDASITVSQPIGSVMPVYHFNGVIQNLRGWVKCDGQTITQTAYETLHGAGTWASDGVASSPVAGLYTPNLVNRYLVGATTAGQAGTTAITSVGNGSHQINLSHSHDFAHDSGDNNTTRLVTQSSNGSDRYYPSTNGSLGVTSIQPESIQIQYWIKVC